MTKYHARYLAVCREVMATLPKREALAWLRANRRLADKSMAQLEAKWALEKHRIETSPAQFRMETP